jgi:hypothetical protein
MIKAKTDVDWPKLLGHVIALFGMAFLAKLAWNHYTTITQLPTIDYWHAVIALYCLNHVDSWFHRESFLKEPE